MGVSQIAFLLSECRNDILNLRIKLYQRALFVNWTNVLFFLVKERKLSLYVHQETTLILSYLDFSVELSLYETTL